MLSTIRVRCCAPHRLSRALLGLGQRPLQIQQRSLSAGSAPPGEFKVVLDGETLYVPQDLAEALGWDSTASAPTMEGGETSEQSSRESVPLTLSGWAPHYFAIAQTGSEADALARRTAGSARDPAVQEVLDYFKDR